MRQPPQPPLDPAGARADPVGDVGELLPGVRDRARSASTPQTRQPASASAPANRPTPQYRSRARSRRRPQPVEHGVDQGVGGRRVHLPEPGRHRQSAATRSCTAGARLLASTQSALVDPVATRDSGGGDPAATAGVRQRRQHLGGDAVTAPRARAGRAASITVAHPGPPAAGRRRSRRARPPRPHRPSRSRPAGAAARRPRPLQPPLRGRGRRAGSRSRRTVRVRRSGTAARPGPGSASSTSTASARQNRSWLVVGDPTITRSPGSACRTKITRPSCRATQCPPCATGPTSHRPDQLRRSTRRASAPRSRRGHAHARRVHRSEPRPARRRDRRRLRAARSAPRPCRRTASW